MSLALTKVSNIRAQEEKLSSPTLTITSFTVWSSVAVSASGMSSFAVDLLVITNGAVLESFPISPISRLLIRRMCTNGTLSLSPLLEFPFGWSGSRAEFGLLLA
jgi:PIN domain nuclease of toxin-antitoxin system